MKAVLFDTDGSVSVRDCPRPGLPEGGVVVRTEACGLCSGELMRWYMAGKAPHVLGHEVCGLVEESADPRFPPGSRIAPHHHAACGRCEDCAAGRDVHCAQWKATRLEPGGMAEAFAAGPWHLEEAVRADSLRPQDAALVEPLGCVAKSLARLGPPRGRVGVVGLGSLGLAHALLLGDAVGYETNPARARWAEAHGVEARSPRQAGPARDWVVCPGSEEALAFAVRNSLPDARIVLFAPTPPGEPARVDLHAAYFSDVTLVSSYSCGPKETAVAAGWLAVGRVRAEQLVSHFVALADIPAAYNEMEAGRMLKAMAVMA